MQNLSLTASYMSFWIFTTPETLTRWPQGEPFATSPGDPALLPVGLVLLVVFLVAVGLQVRALRVATVKVS